jgi:glycosyltransferase involved in cell wall biosynthesis
VNRGIVAAPALPVVSIVAPVYNESRTLPEFVHRITAVCDALEPRYRFELVLVDDGSRDDSLEVAKSLITQEPRLRIIELRRNFGQTAALQAGLAAATGDIVISMDADLQHFPEDIPAFLSTLEEGYDLVCGWRHERQEGIVRRWPSQAANLIIRRAVGLKIHDFGTTFRCYRRDLVAQIRLLGEQHRFVPALAELVGARVTEIKIHNIGRPVGTSNYGIGRTLNVALDILFLYFTKRYFTRPLKAFGKIALVLFAAGATIGAVLLGYSLWTGVPTVREHSGWFILSMMLSLAALQILLTGILAEIIVRIYYRLGDAEGYVVRRAWDRSST